jgi:hypothetical protein
MVGRDILPRQAWVEHLVAAWQRTESRDLSTPPQSLRSFVLGRDDRTQKVILGTLRADCRRLQLAISTQRIARLFLGLRADKTVLDTGTGPRV